MLISCQRIDGVAAERLDERLLRGEPRGERPRRAIAFALSEQALDERGVRAHRALEARDVDHIDADAGDHAAPAPCVTRP